MVKIVGQQGEVRVYRIDALPTNFKFIEPEKNRDGYAIISHSEKGHHHVIADADADVMERVDNVPAGMRIFYAIVKNPDRALRQDAPTPHGEIPLEPGGIYELTVDREFNPFLEQARQVRD